jgi:hypothetical protein
MIKILIKRVAVLALAAAIGIAWSRVRPQQPRGTSTAPGVKGQ